MNRKTRLRCLAPILTALAALIGGSGGTLGAVADADRAKQAAEELDKAADSIRVRIRNSEPRPTTHDTNPSRLMANAILLCMKSERLVVDAKTYCLTRSFIDLDYCNDTLAECHESGTGPAA